MNRLHHFFTAERERASCSYTPSNSAVISLADSFLRAKNRTTARCSITSKDSQTIYFKWIRDLHRLGTLISGFLLNKQEVRPVEETAHKMVWTFEVEWARGKNVPSNEIMHKDKRLKPGMIMMLLLSQKVHSDELSECLFDIIRKYSSVLGKTIPVHGLHVGSALTRSRQE
jgi:hypothetical protein